MTALMPEHRVEHRVRTGEYAELENLAERIPREAAHSVREATQRECDADLRANDALLSRANTLLAASGVAVGLLVGLTKDAALDTRCERALLVAALAAATGAVLLVVLCLMVRTDRTVMANPALFGRRITEESDESAWLRDYDLSLALVYADIRFELRDRHQRRATLLRLAQAGYILFLLLVGLLGLAIL